jgi:hypothetical protein
MSYHELVNITLSVKERSTRRQRLTPNLFPYVPPPRLASNNLRPGGIIFSTVLLCAIAFTPILPGDSLASSGKTRCLLIVAKLVDGLDFELGDDFGGHRDRKAC